MPNLLDEASGLVAFVRTVEAGSFSAAAKTSRTSPSVISKGVGRLEKLIGARLFLRTTRALALTPEGQGLFDRVAPLLQQLDTSDEVALNPMTIRGRVRFSMPSELASFFLPPIFQEFAAAYPGVSLDVSLSDKKVDLVRENYDVALRVGADGGGDLRIRKLCDVPMVIVASPEFALKHGTRLTSTKLATVPFVRYSVDGVTPRIAFADGNSILPIGRVDCDSGKALRAAALDGLGAAFLMKCTVLEELSNGSLVDVAVPGALPAQSLNLMHAFGPFPPVRVRHFCDFVVERTREMHELR